MFTSPINLLVDYLFIDILSAPTVDSLKLDELDTFHHLAGAMSSFGSNAINATRRVGRRISQAAVQATVRMTSVTQPATEKIQRARTIPPATLEAQIIASRTASQLMKQIQQENQTQVARRKTEREMSVTSKRLTIRKQQKSSARLSSSSTDGHGSGSRGGNGVRKGDKLSSTLLPTEAALETLFTELCVDLIEQRKLLPPEEQEIFDEKWG
jgi:hypothetical protein